MAKRKARIDSAFLSDYDETVVPRACPPEQADCARGGPLGDNWAAWDADFFAAAAPLLHDAPWVMLRGNDYIRVWINRGGTHYLVHLVPA